MKRLVGLLIVLSLVMAPTAASASRKPHLSTMLLNINELPTGWSVQAPSASSGGATGCLSPRRLMPRHFATASAYFADGSLPQLVESLYAYDQPVAETFVRAIAVMNRCHTLSLSDGKKRLTVHVGKMSFPRIGNDSSAYDFAFSVQGISAGADVLIARKGRVVLLVMELDLGTPNIDQFEHFVRLAAAKVTV